MQSETLLTGRIFDDRGNRMSPTHARKSGIKYRYYLSSALLQGIAERAGSVCRVPAAQIDALVVRSVRDRLALSEPTDDRAIVERHVARVESCGLLVRIPPRPLDTHGDAEGVRELRRELTACLRTGRVLRVPKARTRRRGNGFVSPEIMISQRPAEAADRAVPGHWEGDLILGLGSSAIGTWSSARRALRCCCIFPVLR